MQVPNPLSAALQGSDALASRAKKGVALTDLSIPIRSADPFSRQQVGPDAEAHAGTPQLLRAGLASDCVPHLGMGDAQGPVTDRWF
jgi:hypothetical protein